MVINSEEPLEAVFNKTDPSNFVLVSRSRLSLGPVSYTHLHGDKKVTGVTVASLDGPAKEISCEAVFVAVGRIPDTELFRGQVALDGTGYIIADETTKTNLPGVFAVGDVRTKPLRQIVTAAADGAVASRFIEEYFRCV